MTRRFASLFLVMLSTIVAVVPAWAAGDAVKDSDNPAYTWDVGDLYASPEAWGAERDRVKAQAEALDKFAGTLARGAADLFKALDAISAVNRQLARLYVYAQLKADENVKVAVNQERKQAAIALLTLVNARTAWVAPEIVAIGAPKILAFEARHAELKTRFGFFLDNTLRARDHTLSAEGERIMATAGDVLAQPGNIFNQLVDGETPWKTITLSTGESVRIDEPGYQKYRQSANRYDRRKVYAAFYEALAGFKGTNGANLNTQVLADEFDAKVRHFPNALADAVFADNMPEAVYRTLIAETHAGLPALHRYYRMRSASATS